VSALAHGDFGPSFKYKDFSVTELIAQGFPVTLEIGVAALLLAVLVGIPAGVFAALHHNSAARLRHDVAGRGRIAVPSFVVLPFLGLLFGIRLHWLPVAGWEPDSIRHLILPVLALSLPPLAYMARMMRGSMLEVLRSGFNPHGVRQGSCRCASSSCGMRCGPRCFHRGLPCSRGRGHPDGFSGGGVDRGTAGIGRYLVQGALNRRLHAGEWAWSSFTRLC